MRWLREFRRDRRGLSAIEFAFIAPLMILIYFAISELCQAMLAERKVAHASSAVGDLVSQVGSVTPAQLTDVYDAASTIIAPFSTTPMQVRVSSVATDANNNATVTWSNAQNATALSKGASVMLPANLLVANQSVIMSEVIYTYNSPFNYLFKNAIVFDQLFYSRPRLTTSVSCATC